VIDAMDEKHVKEKRAKAPKINEKYLLSYIILDL
jgi:hypothetical protein